MIDMKKLLVACECGGTGFIAVAARAGILSLATSVSLNTTPDAVGGLYQQTYLPDGCPGVASNMKGWCDKHSLNAMQSITSQAKTRNPTLDSSAGFLFFSRLSLIGLSFPNQR